MFSVEWVLSWYINKNIIIIKYNNNNNNDKYYALDSTYDKYVNKSTLYTIFIFLIYNIIISYSISIH